MAVIKLHLGVVQNALVHLHRAFVLLHRCHLGVQLLLGNRIAGKSLLVAVQIDFGVLEEWQLVALQLTFRLGHRRPGLGPGSISAIRGHASLHHLAFLIFHRHDLALHAAVDGNGFERRHYAKGIHIDADVALTRGGSADGCGPKSAEAATASAVRPPPCWRFGNLARLQAAKANNNAAPMQPYPIMAADHRARRFRRLTAVLD